MKAIPVVIGQNEYVHRVLRSTIYVRNDLTGRLGELSKRRREVRDFRFFQRFFWSFSDIDWH